MKNLSFFNKIVFFVNNILALLFVASLAIPYIPPKSFPLLSVLSLAMPLLILTHVIFIAYWIIIGFKKQFLLSGIIIFLAIFLKIFPYKFKNDSLPDAKGLKVMTYNVRLFNHYDWIDVKDIPQKISKLIEEQDPDIVCIQEFYKDDRFQIDYPYRYFKLDNEKKTTGLVIYSKYPIFRKGSLDFQNTNNNAVYADIVIKNDTIRFYNVHLETTGIKPNRKFFEEKGSERVVKRIAKAFVKQQEQVEILVKSMSETSLKTIVCGDFNNTSYSWAYRKIKGDLNDTFLEAGTGFGKTYDFNGYPLRIDFILSDPKIEILSHQNIKIVYSDHFPLVSIIKP